MDYKFGFNSRQWLPSVSVEKYNEKFYGSSVDKVMYGYINGRTEENNIDQRYRVYIPELGEFLKASIEEPIGSTNINGIGKKPTAPPDGTPVLVRRLQESNQYIITGTINLPGLSYAQNVLQNKELKNPDELPLWKPPINISVATELDTESELTVWPLDIRGANPNYQEPVRTGDNIPGAFEVNSPKGINYKFTPTATIDYSPMKINKVQGKLKTIEEKAAEQAKRKLKKGIKDLERQIERNFVFFGGQIIAGAVNRQVGSLLYSITSDSDFSNLVRQIDNTLESVVRLIELGDSLLQYFSQDHSAIIEDLLDTFGQFDLDLGVANFDIDFSLTSVDLNLDLRVGTGLPILDSALNQLAESLFNSLVDNLLKNFSIANVLGIGTDELLGNSTTDPRQTYVSNIFTPILRTTGRRNYTRLNFSDIIGIVRNVDDIFQFTTSETYLNPQVLIDSNTLRLNDSKTKLAKYIVNVSNDPQLFSLCNYILSFYEQPTPVNYVALAALSSIDYSDKLKLLFLYGYYTLSADKVLNLATCILPRTRLNVIQNYDWSNTETYLNLQRFYPSDIIYDPLALDNSLLKDTLTNNLTIDALDYLEVGQLSSYINQVIINKAYIDIRSIPAKFTKLKELTNKVFPYTTRGFDNNDNQ